ncbi:MAG: hypothetical protein HC812_00180 [Leptolyngbya sp. RL_3_1]|nr:hypothetical protein [Leptolyngbya sp. RL_3_1]
MRFSAQREVSTVMGRQGFNQGMTRISLVHPHPYPAQPQFIGSNVAAATNACWSSSWALIP